MQIKTIEKFNLKKNMTNNQINLKLSQQQSANIAATLLRLSLAIMFLSHAYLKYAIFTLVGTASFFASLGLPEFLAYVVFAFELVGGVLLLLGFQTRLVILALLPVLLGATWAHLGNGWVFSAPNGGYEYPLFLVILGIVQFFLGDGYLATTRSGKSIL